MAAGDCTKVTEECIEALHNKTFQEAVIFVESNSCHGHFQFSSVVCICMEIRRIIQADRCLQRTCNPQAEKLQFPRLRFTGHGEVN